LGTRRKPLKQPGFLEQRRHSGRWAWSIVGVAIARRRRDGAISGSDLRTLASRRALGSIANSLVATSGQCPPTGETRTKKSSRTRRSLVLQQSCSLPGLCDGLSQGQAPWRYKTKYDPLAVATSCTLASPNGSSRTSRIGTRGRTSYGSACSSGGSRCGDVLPRACEAGADGASPSFHPSLRAPALWYTLPRSSGR